MYKMTELNLLNKTRKKEPNLTPTDKTKFMIINVAEPPKESIIKNPGFATHRNKSSFEENFIDQQ